MFLLQHCLVFKLKGKKKKKITQMMVNHKILFTTINESGLAFSTDTGGADLHGLGDLGFLCGLSRGLQKEKYIKYSTPLHTTILYKIKLTISK